MPFRGAKISASLRATICKGSPVETSLALISIGSALFSYVAP